tara:strand:- start:7606 stop:8544 length:939 start_codon:yes stop_codon:yes gene_type:complete
MKLYECISRIEDNVLSNSDRQGKAVNPLFTKQAIVNALESSLWDYAQTTLGLEGIKTYALVSGQSKIVAPSDRIRSQQYRTIAAIVSQRWYLLEIQSQTYMKNTFFANTLGANIPTRASLWEDEIEIRPVPRSTYKQTTLDGNITATDTDIDVVSTAGFLRYGGRIHLGGEVISYESTDDTTFKGCRRGLENTVAKIHTLGSVICEGNFWIYYNKKHWEIPMFDSSTIDPDYLTKEMEINDVHMPAVINETSYKLLCRVDMDRALLYRADYKAFLEQAKWGIKEGQANQNIGSTMSNPFLFQTSAYGEPLLM